MNTETLERPNVDLLRSTILNNFSSFDRNPLLNLILNTDSYKLYHKKMYPPGTTNLHSGVLARGLSEEVQDLYERFLPDETPMVNFVGAQMFNLEYLSRPITMRDIDQAITVAAPHGFEVNREDWEYIVKEHKGYLPIRIKAVREGSAVPVGEILATVEATDPKCFWLVTYIETALLRAIWYPSTVASKDLIAKKVLKKFMDETAVYDPAELDFMLHDFGARGVSSHESAAIGGMAHLVHFKGTDTIAGALAAMHYYDSEMPGFSVPASEHSVHSSWGSHREAEGYENMLDLFSKPGAIVSVVSDTYNIHRAAEKIWGEELREKVISSGGRLVVRPDSGDPLTVPIEIIEILMDKFGYTTNEKGYKVLPDYIRVLQGDGITVTSMAQILENMKDRNIAANNIVFGMGAGTLQKVDRDTFNFAMKCTAKEENGEWVDIFKAAKGKKSHKGRTTLMRHRVTGKFRTVDATTGQGYNEVEALNTIYHNGIVENMLQNFTNVRSEAAKGL